MGMYADATTDSSFDCKRLDDDEKLQEKIAEKSSILALQNGRVCETEEILQKILQTIYKAKEKKKTSERYFSQTKK